MAAAFDESTGLVIIVIDLSLRARLHIAMGRLTRLTEQLPSTGELGKAIDQLDQLVRETVKTAIFPTGEIVTHDKRGSTYRVYGTTHLNSADEHEMVTDRDDRGFIAEVKFEKIAFDRDELILYADVTTGALSTRPTAEFRDGRFSKTETLPADQRPPGS